MADLLVLLRPAELAEWHRLQAEKLEHTELAEKKRVASVPQRE